MFGAKTRNDDQNNLSSIKSIKWVISPNLRYRPLFTPGPVQNQTQFTNSAVHAKFHRIFRTEMIDPQIADMLYASLIYRRQIKSAMIFPAVRFSTLSK